MHSHNSGTGMTNTRTRNPYRDLNGRFCSEEEGIRADQYRTWVRMGLQNSAQLMLKYYDDHGRRKLHVSGEEREAWKAATKEARELLFSLKGAAHQGNGGARSDIQYHGWLV
jgi:hypothetical protein